jgi:protein-disulfide isomerase
MNRIRFNGRGLALVLTALLAPAVMSAAGQGQAPKVENIDIAGAPTLGSDNAPVTLVIFADVGSVTTGGMGVILHGLVEKFPSALKVCFRHAPAADQPGHVLAHLAAIAAGEQGKFWEMLDLLLANRARHGSEDLLGMAAQLALDTTRFSQDLDVVTAHQRIDDDRRQAQSLTIGANPTFFVNGVRLTGAKSLTELAAQIDSAIAATRGAGVANR